MSAQVISIHPIQRPQFDNRRISQRAFWFLDNTQTLARYWRECGMAIGLENPTEVDHQEFDLWLTTMWERERARTRLPYGTAL